MNVIFKTLVEDERTIIATNFEIEREKRFEAGDNVYVINLIVPTGRHILYSDIDEANIEAIYNRIIKRVEAINNGEQVSNVIDMYSI